MVFGFSILSGSRLPDPLTLSQEMARHRGRLEEEKHDELSQLRYWLTVHQFPRPLIRFYGNVESERKKHFVRSLCVPHFLSACDVHGRPAPLLLWL